MRYLGDNIGFFHGDGNIVGKNITVSGNITIKKDLLPNLESEFQKAILDFSENLNARVKDLQIPQEDNQAIIENIQELAKEVEGEKLKQKVGEIKKSEIKATLFRIAKNVLKVLPKTAETLALFTPLAPFSKHIGEGAGYLVEAIQKEL